MITHYIFFTTIMVYYTFCSHLEIRDLNNNPGILAIKVGKVSMKEGTHTLIHEINLYPFRTILNQYEEIIYKLQKNTNITSIVTIIKRKHEQADFILHNLIPKRKTKKSLDFLGTAIKVITGNLDNNDLITLNNQLQNLKNSDNLLINENNEQIKINEQFQKRINDLTEQAHKQSIQTENFIKQTRAMIDRSLNWEHMFQLQSIIFNLDFIIHQLDTIFESIQLSKIGIISKALLVPSELDFATNLLESQGIKIESYDQTYQYLEPIAFHNGSSIILLVRIPKLREGEFTQLRIETIPVHNKTISLNTTKAIVSQNESYLANSACKRIERNWICDVTKLFNITSNQCLHQLLRGSPSHCDFIDHPTKVEIKIIDGIGILIENAIEPVLLENTCGYGAGNLSGTFLISFKNCSITLNGTFYDDQTYKFQDKITILPLDHVTVSKANIRIEPMEQLKMLQIKNRHKLENLENANQLTNSTNLGSTIFIILLVSGISFVIIREIRNLKRRLTVRIPAVTETSN